MAILRIAFFLLRGFLLSRSALAAENLALRQQVAVYKQSVKRPKLRLRDRIFWVLLSRLWSNWQSALAIVPTRNGHQVAPYGIQVVLAMEVAGRETRPPLHRTRNP